MTTFIKNSKIQIGQRVAVYEINGEVLCLGTVVSGNCSNSCKMKNLTVSFDDGAVFDFYPNSLGQLINKKINMSVFILPTTFPSE